MRTQTERVTNCREQILFETSPTVPYRFSMQAPSATYEARTNANT